MKCILFYVSVYADKMTNMVLRSVNAWTKWKPGHLFLQNFLTCSTRDRCYIKWPTGKIRVYFFPALPPTHATLPAFQLLQHTELGKLLALKIINIEMEYLKARPIYLVSGSLPESIVAHWSATARCLNLSSWKNKGFCSVLVFPNSLFDNFTHLYNKPWLSTNHFPIFMSFFVCHPLSLR